MIVFTPNGTLNVATDASDLPESASGNNVSSGAMVRCKNLRTNEPGKAKLRDGSQKLNGSAINTAIYWIEEQGGYRYTFSGTIIYKDETSIQTGLTSAQWVAIKYNAYNDESQNIFALNGTDRKRIKSSSVYEWGLAPPTFAPTLSAGPGVGLTGVYNLKYTYVRKVGSTVVAESNPSPAASAGVTLSDQSLSVEITEPDDSQVTHVRLYRTLANGELYYLDEEIDVGGYDYGYSFDWEEADAYISGTGFKFTETSTATAGATSTGGSGGQVAVSSVSASVWDELSSLAGYRLNSGGTAEYTAVSRVYSAISNEWLLSGSAGDYEVRATVSSGSLSTGTEDTWTALSSTQTWTRASPGGGGSSSCTFLVEIRLASSGAVLDSAVVTLEAESG